MSILIGCCLVLGIRCCGRFGAAGLGTFPCQDHCLFNTTADPSETVDLSNNTELSGLLYEMLTRYAELSKQGILDLALSMTNPPGGVTPPCRTCRVACPSKTWLPHADLELAIRWCARVAGGDVFGLPEMLKETGEICVAHLNDSCAVADSLHVVEPCGYTAGGLY